MPRVANTRPALASLVDVQQMDEKLGSPRCCDHFVENDVVGENIRHALGASSETLKDARPVAELQQSPPFPLRRALGDLRIECVGSLRHQPSYNARREGPLTRRPRHWALESLETGASEIQSKNGRPTELYAAGNSSARRLCRTSWGVETVYAAQWCCIC